jgi:phage terminase small subunit
MMMALSDKHSRFVDEYMKCMNATEAYRRVYDCSEEAARRAASRLLTNVDVQDEVERRQIKAQEDSGISVRWVLDKYRDIVDNCLQNEPATAKGALDSIGKHLGMFKDKIEHSGSVGVRIVDDL